MGILDVWAGEVLIVTKGSRKKNNGSTIKALTPSPSSLMAVGTLAVGNIKFFNKFFFLNGSAFIPPPFLNGTAIRKRTFFAAFLSEDG